MLRCLHSHCFVTVPKTQEEAHQELHGEFECALASCKGAPRSYFRDEIDLIRHLRNRHNVNGAAILSEMSRAGDSIARECYLEPKRRSRLQDCSICSKHQEDVHLKQDG